MRAWAVVENEAPLKEIELPTPEPKGTEVLLETTHCGVCHSDLHIWEGCYDLGGGQVMNLKDRGVTLPLAMGHEIVGRVVKLGPEATGVQAGRPAHRLSVGRLRHLRRLPGGRGQHVPDAAQRSACSSTAATPRMCWRRIRATWSIPARSIRRVAATYACSGITVYSAIRKVMPLPPDEPIVLVGAGGLGLHAIAVLKALGHRAIVSVDISAEKREAAARAGATATVDGTGDGVGQARSSRPAAGRRWRSSTW